MTQLISIIITTYKAVDHLLCAVRSLLRTDICKEFYKFEVVIYGDGGGEKSETVIHQCAQVLQDAGITFIVTYEPQNLGLVAALNAACKMARGEWLFVVNDDMVFPSGWMTAVARYLKPRRILSLACIEPPLMGRTSASCFYANNLGLDPLAFDFESLDKFQQTIVAEVDLVAGVNYPFLIESEIFRELGQADERFLGPYHDPDLFLRARILKLEMVRLQTFALYHFSGVSLRFGNQSQIKSQKSIRWIQKENDSRLIFIKKWGAKPKAKFGYIPQTKVDEIWDFKSASFFKKINYILLLGWEIFRNRWRLNLHKLKFKMNSFI